ncbi:secreted phosphoprotein 24 [Pteronotus mesoamericanus]|uniref:secreted phosphoprotein 24 n=1 Tax=Pteronotus mesoamericanus TaxID=1884717 RepID=UPI0023EB9838|nr:secreted phosphoprotein 24 [Pteronotus parnellii mesoamericanus]XP_054426473.1 secreted phosphoprotein 24 [Pteronotus parnellii mesoamericanus]XP_054426482.1 secreted phosphoprotein 24 [Pteronotus parnellii mesoamericanus]
MEKMVLEILVMLVLGMNSPPCAGFPVYDYNVSSLRQALGASVADVNSRSLGPYLFRAFRSSLKRVNVLDENSLSMDIEFSIRETTCRRGSGEDPATCDFQRGYFVPTAACRSTVRMSDGQVQAVWVRCRWASSSESDSSEEMGFRYILGSPQGRNSDLFGLAPDGRRSEQFYGRSLEVMRRVFPPGNQWSPRLWHRARVDMGFE